MSRDKHRVYLHLLASFSASVLSQSLPGCPPPISSFISYPEKVTVPKISPFKVATLQFRENTYFGSARCSLVQDLTDKKDLVLKSFRLEESSLNVRNSKVKTCTVFLINDKLKENVLDIEVILIVTLNEGYRRFCQSNSIISSTARIQINFCDPERCHDKKTGWEIVGNVVSYKNGRSVDSDGLNQLTQTLEITGGQNLIVEADTKRNQDQDGQEEVNTESGSVRVQQGPDADVSNKVVLGLALVVTLIALSLILGLIYFWCPALCCCMRETARGKINLDSTKILTVRDAQGKVIEDAKSVEVWKTQGNTIRTLEVLDNKTARSKNSRFSHLLHSDPSSGTLTRSSNLLPDSEATRSLRSRSRYSKTPVKVINVSENLDGLIILRRPDQTSRSRNSRVTLLEELNPRKLIFEREIDYGQDRGGRLEYQDPYTDRRQELQDTDRSQRQEYGAQPQTGRRLSYSRHYSATSERDTRDSPATRQMIPR